MKYHIALGLLLLGCGPSSWSEPLAPNTYFIGCKRSIRGCYEEAYWRCPHGFKMVSESSSENYTIISNHLISVKRNEYVIMCNKKKVRDIWTNPYRDE